MTLSRATVAVLLLVLAGCATSTDGTASPGPTAPVATSTPTTAPEQPSLPPRVRSFDVATLDPCTLLTQAQQDTFGINRPVQGPTTDDPLPGATACGFINSADPSGAIGYGVSTDVARNAASLLASGALIGVETIGGVGALVIDGGNRGCSYVLDTSDDANIQVGSTSTGSTAAIDCPKAKDLAEAVMTTLTALQPG